jgi:pimeloyl-ACP methyl ester carboxylesterase
MIRTRLPALLLAASFVPAASAQRTAVNAENRYVDVRGDRIAYRTLGSGSPILIANRMRGTLDTWDPAFLDALAARHTLYWFDYPGIGYSSGALPADHGLVARFVADFATAVGVERFAILGWSWGGLAAQALLLQAPERVSHAILIGTNPPGAVQIPIQQVFLERAVKPVNDLADEEVLFFEPRSESSRRAAKASHDRIHGRPGVAARIPAEPAQFDVYFAAAKAFAADAEGRREKLTAARVSMLVVCGDNDPSTAGQNWFPLVGKLRNAQFLFYSEAGHGPQHQHPELTAEYIVTFLARTAR